MAALGVGIGIGRARAPDYAPRISSLGAAMPDWCDAFLAPAGEGEFFASRLWYDTVLRHGLAPGETACCAEAGAMMLPLLQRDGRLHGLTTPYTLDWRPLPARGADERSLVAAGRALARLLRRGPPVRLDTIDPEAPGLVPLLQGLRRGGILALRYDHVLNWHAALPPGTRWEEYLAARPPALRTTVRRKLARALRDLTYARVTSPGPALDAGITDYEAVRAASWKPDEPFPAFDAALMRAAAAAGLLRLGLLRRRDGSPVAAQYWVLDHGGARATVLKLCHAEAARADSPGTALTALMIRDLLETDGVRALDFGRGDDAYKRLWVDMPRRRIGLVLADPLHPAGLAALTRQGVGALLRRALRALPRGVGVRG